MGKSYGPCTENFVSSQAIHKWKHWQDDKQNYNF